MLERRGLMGDDEERSLGARETRLRRASDKELARSAMRSAARYGYFVCDDLATDEAGLIDYLAVGPPDVTVIVGRDDGATLAAVIGTRRSCFWMASPSRTILVGRRKS
jgi:hypothetical protein